MTTFVMKITLNGEKRELAEPQTVKSLLESIGLGGKPVVDVWGFLKNANVVY